MTNTDDSGKISVKNVTGETATIDKRKFTEYALDPVKQPDKARAFKEALGFDKSNYELLEKQIREKFDRKKLRDRGKNEYGKKYDMELNITGVNGKSAKVMTSWLDDSKEANDFHMTSLYINK